MARHERTPRWFMRLQWRSHRAAWNLSGARLGTSVMGMPVIEVITRGRKSGLERSILITSLAHGEGWVIAGSNAGSNNDPAWVHNLRANPSAKVRTRAGTVPVRAEFLGGEEYASAWERFAATSDSYTEYASMIDRSVPLVLLVPEQPNSGD